MSRLVHTVDTMIACVINGRALLILPNDFATLVGEILTGSSDQERIFFKVAVLQNLGVGDIRRNYPRLEREFIDGVKNRISAGDFDPCYIFEEGKAREYVEEYLEAFRSSFRHINFTTGLLHDGDDEIINVSIRAKQSLLDKALNRYGAVQHEWNFLRSEIHRIEGSSLNFVLSVGDLKYQFDPHSVRQL